MKIRYRAPTRTEKAQAFTALCHDLRFARCATLDEKKVISILDRLTAYSHAHDDANGERSEAEIKRNINQAFWVHIAQDHEKGRQT